MAFREVPVHEVREVLRLWLRGEGSRAVAQGLSEREHVTDLILQVLSAVIVDRQDQVVRA